MTESEELVGKFSLESLFPQYLMTVSDCGEEFVDSRYCSLDDRDIDRRGDARSVYTTFCRHFSCISSLYEGL